MPPISKPTPTPTPTRTVARKKVLAADALFTDVLLALTAIIYYPVILKNAPPRQGLFARQM